MSQSCRKRANMADLPATRGVVSINEEAAQRMALRVTGRLPSGAAHGS